MTATSGKQVSAGLQRVVIYELDADTGYPAATGTTAYDGLEFANGAKTLALNMPDARKIPHIGDDRVTSTQFLAPTDAPTGTLNVDGSDMSVNVKATGVKQYAVGDVTMMSWITDQQGNEPSVGFLGVQSSLDASSKLGRRKFYIMPSIRMFAKPAGMDENAAINQYNIAPNPSTKHLWGTALATGTEGATEAALDEGMSEGRPHIVAFKADGSTTAFLFSSDKQATSTTKIAGIWDNGTVQTVGVTKAVTGITFNVAPTSGHIIVVMYEY